MCAMNQSWKQCWLVVIVQETVLRGSLLSLRGLCGREYVSKQKPLTIMWQGRAFGRAQETSRYCSRDLLFRPPSTWFSCGGLLPCCMQRRLHSITQPSPSLHRLRHVTRPGPQSPPLPERSDMMETVCSWLILAAAITPGPVCSCSPELTWWLFLWVQAPGSFCLCKPAHSLRRNPAFCSN